MRDPVSPGEAVGPPPTDGPARTISHYEGWKMPHGNVVYEFPSRRVEAEFDTIEEALTHADQLNKWLASRPAPDRRYRMFVPPAERTEAELVAMIDRMLDPEEKAAAISVAHLERLLELEAAEER